MSKMRNISGGVGELKGRVDNKSVQPLLDQASNTADQTLNFEYQKKFGRPSTPISRFERNERLAKGV